MQSLRTEPTLPQGEADALHAELVAAHRDLTPEASAGLNARLLLLLINHIGDAATVREALRLAQAAGTPEAVPDGGALPGPGPSGP